MSAVIVAYPIAPSVIKSIALGVITAVASTLYRLLAGSGNECVTESVCKNVATVKTELIFCTSSVITGIVSGSYCHNSGTYNTYLIFSTGSCRSVAVSGLGASCTCVVGADSCVSCSVVVGGPCAPVVTECRNESCITYGTGLSCKTSSFFSGSMSESLTLSVTASVTGAGAGSSTGSRLHTVTECVDSLEGGIITTLTSTFNVSVVTVLGTCSSLEAV